MEYRGILDYVPLWLLFFVTVGLAFGSVQAGIWIGNRRRLEGKAEKDEPVGTMVGATLGLLGFMLAFTFGMAATRFDDRRQIVVDEANAIGTCYLRAEMIPEPENAKVRKLLREYVDVRLEGTELSKVDRALVRSTDIQNSLWAQAVVYAKREPDSIVMEMFVESLNDVIDMHSKRVMIGLRNRIPLSIWLSLDLVAILGMMQIGYHLGLSGNRSSMAMGALIVTFSTVMLLIADLDRSREGWLQVSQQAMLDLKSSFDSPAPALPNQKLP